MPRRTVYSGPTECHFRVKFYVQNVKHFIFIRLYICEYQYGPFYLARTSDIGVFEKNKQIFLGGKRRLILDIHSKCICSKL